MFKLVRTEPSDLDGLLEFLSIHIVSSYLFIVVYIEYILVVDTYLEA